MKKLESLLIVTALILSFNLFGLDKICQLKKQISESNDIKKSKLYNKLSIEYLNKKELEKALEFGNIALKSAIKHKQAVQQIDALLNISRYYLKKTDYNDAKPHLKKALKLAENLKDKDILIKVWDAQFNVYGSTDTTEDIIYSVTISKNLVHLYKEKKDLKNQVLFTHIQGTLYSILGDNKTSIEYINKSLLLYRRLGDKRRVVQMYTYLANRIQQLGDNKKAFAYLKKAAMEVKSIKKIGAIHARVFYNHWLYYKRLKDYKNALKYINKEIQILQTLKEDYHKYNLFVLYTQKTEIFIELGDFDLAELFMEKFISYKNLKKSQGKSNFKIDYKYYKCKIELQKKNYKKAIKMFLEILPLVKKEDGELGVADVYKCYAEAYIGLKEFKKAEEYLIKGIIIFKKNKKLFKLKTLYLLMSELYSKIKDDANSVKYKKFVEDLNIIENNE